MFVLLFKNMLPKLNAYANSPIVASFFSVGNLFLVLLNTYLENNGRNIILCIKMLLLRNKSQMIVVKTEI